MRQHIGTPAGSPPATGYSHAVAFDGPVVVISGQIPLDSEGKAVGPDAETQTRQVFENVKAALVGAGTDLDHAVKITYYLTDVADLAAVRAVRAEYLNQDQPPASTLVVVSALVDPSFKIEIEVMALLP